MVKNQYAKQLGELSQYFLTQQELVKYYTAVSNHGVMDELQEALAILHGDTVAEVGVVRSSCWAGMETRHHGRTGPTRLPHDNQP